MIELAQESDGEGPPFVLLHAFPLSRRMWESERFRWRNGFRVITPDLPGFGRSPRLPSPSIAGMAEAVWAMLDRLGLREPAVIAGVSMGGYVAFEMLRQQPERIKGLGLWSTRATPDTPEQREGRAKLIKRVEEDGVSILLEASLPKLLSRASTFEQPSLVSLATAMIMTSTVEGVTDALRALADRADSTDLLAAIRCPTPILAGEEDALIPVQEARELHARIPRSKLVIAPRAGHLVNLERPSVFEPAVDEFLQLFR